jgi:hypothetical protein
MLNINTNIMSLSAQNNLSGSQSALSQAISRLSSGKRVNTAADDAAGLAISTTQTASINALTQGASNANNGISMVQTTNGALKSIVDNLQRIRQLAVEAGDGSLDSNALANLQSEVTTRLSEITRVAQQTTFNGQSVLNHRELRHAEVGRKQPEHQRPVGGDRVQRAGGDEFDRLRAHQRQHLSGDTRRHAEHLPGRHLDDEHASDQHELRAFADHRRGLRDGDRQAVESAGVATGGHFGAGASQLDAAKRVEAARLSEALAHRKDGQAHHAALDASGARTAVYCVAICKRP